MVHADVSLRTQVMSVFSFRWVVFENCIGMLTRSTTPQNKMMMVVVLMMTMTYETSQLSVSGGSKLSYLAKNTS